MKEIPYLLQYSFVSKHGTMLVYGENEDKAIEKLRDEIYRLYKGTFLVPPYFKPTDIIINSLTLI